MRKYCEVWITFQSSTLKLNHHNQLQREALKIRNCQWGFCDFGWTAFLVKPRLLTGWITAKLENCTKQRNSSINHWIHFFVPPSSVWQTSGTKKFFSRPKWPDADEKLGLNEYLGKNKDLVFQINESVLIPRIRFKSIFNEQWTPFYFPPVTYGNCTPKKNVKISIPYM